ncbi:MAG: NUDIX domain-containing protein [Bacteroidales bacterium]|nr:NUDIX domain-containing protein [Bacteroidales bacterium]
MLRIFSERKALVFADTLGEGKGVPEFVFHDEGALYNFVMRKFRPKMPADVRVVLQKPDGGVVCAEDAFRAFCARTGIRAAAGGLVKTLDPALGEPEYLYIYRNAMWDLPKGKKEEGESTEENALREVQEETGLHDLKLLRFLENTYHFVDLAKGNTVVKQTSWFEMQTDHKQTPVPQTEEGIREARWLTRAQVRDRLPLMYSSIAALSYAYFQ